MFSHRVKVNPIVPPLIRGFLLNGVLFLLALPLVSQAAFISAITPDGTLGTTVAPPVGNVYNINGGTIKGSNQFHSFGLFSVGTGDIASFNGPSSIANILSRVTGGQQSMIDGTLRSTIPGANLYLLNPAGVLFGANASLDVSGSFHVTTADYLRFTDGARFYADLAQPTVLSVAPVAAFGFLGPNPAAITIQESVLEVPTGKTLSLIGGDTEITGGPFGFISAPSGRIQIASVASSGEVIPSPSGAPLDLDVGSFSAPGQISISNNALITVSGIPGGAIILRGGSLAVDNSFISADTVFLDGTSPGIDLGFTGKIAITNGSVLDTTAFFAERAGDIRIKANNLTITGASEILTSTDPNSLAAQAGDIMIDVDSLSITDGGSLINNFAFSPGVPGAITINAADSVTVDGIHSSGLRSNITSFAFVSPAGPLTINAPTLTLDSGAQVAVGDTTINVQKLNITGGATFNSRIPLGLGRGGDVAITASDLVFMSDSGTGIFAGTPGTGRSGNVTMEVGKLTLADGAAISSGTLGSGAGGLVTINARDEISLAGGQISAISGFGTGPAGQVMLTTPVLSMDTGGFITTSTAGAGHAGDITVNVGKLMMGNNSSMFNGSEGSGPAGKVKVTATESISMSGNSDITSFAGGTGPGGQIVISAPSMNLDNGFIGASTIGVGNAGSVSLTVGDLVLTGGSRVDSSTAGSGQGGNLIINAFNAVAVSGHDIQGRESGIKTAAADTSDGAGGNIAITARDVILTDGGTISASNAGTKDAGTITIIAQEAFVANNGLVTTQAQQGGGGNIVMHVGSLVILSHSKVTATVLTQTGDGGNITIDPPKVVLNDSQIIANAFAGHGGNITITADLFLESPGSLISASSAFGLNGNVTVESPVTNLSGTLAPLPQGFLQAAGLLAQRCAARMGGTSSTFVVAGREGLPLEPGGLLPSPLYEAGPAEALAAAPAQEAPGGAEPVLERVLVAFHDPLRPVVQRRPRLVAEGLEQWCP